MGKSETYGFFENYCSLRPEKDRCKLTNESTLYVINLGQGHLLTLAGLLSIHTLKDLLL